MFRSSLSFILFASAITLFFIFTSISFPEFHTAIAPFVVIASVFLIGIPHGAIDHVISAELFNSGKSVKSHLLFYGSYLLIMFLVGLLWFFAPAAGMLLFLLISVYHFGQADMEDFLLMEGKNHGSYFIRGLLIIGLIILSDVTVTLPIIAEAMNLDPEQLTFVKDLNTYLFAGIISVYLTLITILSYNKRIKNPLNLILDFILIILLFTVTGPLIGFAVYFAVWHSAGHIYEMQQFFKKNNKILSVLTFYKLSLPFTVVSIIGLFILLMINSAIGMDDQFLTLMFIMISVLTLPHMFIVDKMYSTK